MFLGYNTNGFAHHRLADAIAIISKLGYRGFALTLDVHHLDPFAPDRDAQIEAIRPIIQKHDLRLVIETGARFLLDAERKHQPTLLSSEQHERSRRFDFLARSIEIAAVLDADCVSFWSGATPDDAPRSQLMSRLSDECKRLADAAAEKQVRLAFEPEPGMFIDSMEQFAELHHRVNHPAFGLTLDLGHLVCTGELPISRFLTEWKHVLWNIHIEDMKRGIHDHLAFGEGDVDFADAFAGLRQADYRDGLYVELSRHSYDAVNTARRSRCFLEPFMLSEI